ncbi:MAG: flagellar biosynthetic protein FliP [Chlamydiales bacterium]|jgi:flagellar biosynthetic protein FliP
MIRRFLFIALVGFFMALSGPDAVAVQGALEEAAVDAATQPGRFTKALEIALLLTALSLLPAILITITCFTRIVIVLSFVRRALSINELPPNPVLIGLALFLTVFVMQPVGKRVYEQAWEPYQAGTVSVEEAGTLAWTELRGFLVANTRKDEMALFVGMVHAADGDSVGTGPVLDPETLANPSVMVVVPAFILSELKTAFQMGFLLFLPFLVIDLVVSSVLLSMGMFMLPPVMISTPFKILIFVLVDGWRLICESLVTSFITA